MDFLMIGMALTELVLLAAVLWQAGQSGRLRKENRNLRRENALTKKLANKVSIVYDRFVESYEAERTEYESKIWNHEVTIQRLNMVLNEKNREIIELKARKGNANNG